MIDQYLKTLPKTQISHPKVIASITNLETIVKTFIQRYGLSNLINGFGDISKDKVYALGIILHLEGLLESSPSPITITKHFKFLQLVVNQYFKEGKTDGNKNTDSSSTN